LSPETPQKVAAGTVHGRRTAGGFRRILARIPLPADQSRREEIASSVIHGVSAFLSLVAAGRLFATFGSVVQTWHMVILGLYGASLPAVFLCSTMYHATKVLHRKRLFRLLDHASIFILIACSYTAVALIVLRGALGWALFGVVWVLTMGGIAYKIYFLGKLRVLSVIFYVLLGWLAIAAAGPLLEAAPAGLLILLAVGGGFYTVGTLFFAAKFLPYHHAVWHLFVLLGSAVHYAAVVRFVVPGTA